MNTLRVCLTGTIGSGKSRVLSTFGSLLQCDTIQADKIAYQMMQVGEVGYLHFCKNFPEVFLLPSGEIDRATLKKAISENPTLKQQLDDLLHPLIRKQLLNIVPGAGFKKNVIFYEVPLLFEAGWQDDFDLVICTYISYQQGIKRLMKRDSIDRQYAEKLLKLQYGSWQKAMKADIVIDNTYCYTHTLFQLLHVAENIKQLYLMKTGNAVEKS